MKQWKRIRYNFLKRFLSLTLAFMMILGALPMESLLVFADGNGEPSVSSVLVTKTYTGPNELEVMFIEVKGTNLGELGRNPVIVRDAIGNPTALTTIVENDFRLYYKIDNPQGVSRLSVQNEDYNIGAGSMPTITSIDPVSRRVSNEEAVTINGNGFLKEEIEINFYNRSGSLENNPDLLEIEDKKITKSFLETTPGGPYRVEFTYTDEEKNLTIEDNYVDLFTVYGELNISDDITMVPNQGPVDTLVKIKGEKLTGDMSVFFLKETDGSDSYSVNNRGTKVSYQENAEQNSKGEKIVDVFTVKVPSGLEQGRYNVVLTNDVNNVTDLESRIISIKTFTNNIFTVIDNDDTISIEDVDPDYGPETGKDAIIHGRYIGTLSPNVFAPNENSEFKVNNDMEIDPSSNTLKVTYDPKDPNKDIGKYKLIGGKDGVDVKKVEREITVFVGGRATFREGSTFTDSTDKINIRVPSINLKDGEDPAKDVTVDVVTTIYYEDEGEVKTLIVTETETWDGKFTFEPINYKPSITSITPNRIPVDENNEITDGFKISITGTNFVKYRYTDDEGTKIKYPVIDLGGQIVLNPNIDDVDIKMFDDNGNEIDGTEGNDLATKILITVPEGKKVNSGVIDQISRLKVTNPIKNDEPISAEKPYEHMGLSAEGNIRFIRITPDDTPTITEVTPNIITTDGQRGVRIKGQNFRNNISLYLNGEEIRGIQRNGTGTEIIFDAPARPEGYYQIILQNEEGNLAVYNNFIYVKTYTEPKIIDFNPKKGSANTLVTLKGENLLLPNPLVQNLEGMGIYRLIGTRVLLNNEDINRYNLGDDGETIELQPYSAPADKPIVKIEDSSLKLSDYHHSVMLRDDSSESHYKIYYDTVLGKVLLTDGDKNVYELLIKNDSIFGKKAGEIEEQILTSSDDMNIPNNKIKVGDMVLSILTPYEISEKDGVDAITGNRVKVINNNELTFEVPPLPREGYYNLRIVNPDTNYDERIGNNGFYYFFQPEYNPKIIDIKPNQGSTDGQYYIDILGEGFKDNGENDKTSVIIGSVVVESKDIEVSVDGKKLRVKVPAYPGDLAKETNTDRKTVAVVVVNPDGGSASKEDGFTYIIPISAPRITGLILNKGTASGGESVIIEGSGFRFYEPYTDSNNNAQWDLGEPFNNLNGNEDADGNPIWDDLRYWLSAELKEKYDELAKDYDRNIKPILPKVYFGGEEVAIKSFTATTIEVETPKGVKGPVEVYLVNNDYGTSNKVTFTYEGSNPKVNTILPSVGRKQGYDKVEIIGEGFHESKVNVIKSVNEVIEQTLQIIQFGDSNDINISNRDIPIDAPQNSGRIRDRLSTVKVGNLTVDYDATQDQRRLSFTIEEGTGDSKVIYKLEDIKYDDTEIFFPVNLLKDSNGNTYSGYEYIRVRLDKIPGANTTSRLRVDRGFSPEATLKNSGHIILRTPSYYTVGKVPVIVINPDSGEATGEFEYKNPSTDPTITNILKNGEEGNIEDNKRIIRVNYNGGNDITIIGSEFMNPVRSIKIGNAVEITNGITYTPSDGSLANRLSFTMPAVGEEYLNDEYRVVVENTDGGVAGSDEGPEEPIYIIFTKGETDDLAIRNITPNSGPATGGTTVTIEGNDFRRTMDGYDEEIKIYFGSGADQVRVSNENIVSIDLNKIVLKTPAHAPGTVAVKVENPDGNIVELANGFTYLSNPKITSVVDPLDPNERTPISIISILGDQEIKLKGSGFMEGAKVYFVPKIRPAEDNELGSANVIYIGEDAYILEEGTEGTDYNWIDSQTATIKVPQGKVDTFGVIVVNPDGGASPIYTNLTYGLPELSAPSWIAAELVYDRFIRVHWGEVAGAEEYEIFVVIDDKTTELIGSTELTSFVYNDLEPKTRYRFIVKAVGDFGSSRPSMESNTVRTGSVVGPPDEDGALGEDTTMTKTGSTANVVIGSKDRSRGDLVIDLTRGALAGSDDLVISIPADVVVNSGSRNIRVTGKDFALQFQPSVFNIANVRENSNKADAGVRFLIGPDKGNTQVQSGNQLSTVYKLEASTYVGQTNTPIDYLANDISFVLDYDTGKANLRKLNNADFNYFNSVNNAWQPVGGSVTTIDGMISGKINRLGRYTVIGSRR